MTELKCPFCGEKLYDDDFDVRLFACYGSSCKNSICKKEYAGTKELWQALIDTKKKLDDLSDKNGKLKSKLDIAIDALKNMKEIIDNYEYGNGLYYALDGHDTMLIANYVEKTIAEITALEQKDVK